MKAQAGDRLIVKGHRVSEPDRAAEIVEVLGDDGAPHRVRWDDRGHETQIYPGTDARIEHPVS